MQSSRRVRSILRSYIAPGVAVTVLVVVEVEVTVEVVHLLGAARPNTAWLMASNARASLPNIVNDSD